MPIPLLAALGAAQSLYGVYQNLKANQGVNSLKEPNGFRVTPEQQQSYDNAQQMAKSGYTPQEQASFENNMNRRSNTAYNKAIVYGGNNLAGAIQAGINYGNAGALADYAAKDAQLRRQNIRYSDQLGEQITAQKNRDTAQQWQNYNMKAQAYGGAAKQGIQNIFGGANMAAAGYLGNPDNTVSDSRTPGTGISVNKMTPINPFNSTSNPATSLSTVNYTPPPSINTSSNYNWGGIDWSKTGGYK